CAVEAHVFMRPAHSCLSDPFEVQILASDDLNRDPVDHDSNCPLNVLPGPWELNCHRQVVANPVSARPDQAGGVQSCDVRRVGPRTEIKVGRVVSASRPECLSRSTNNN